MKQTNIEVLEISGIKTTIRIDNTYTVIIDTEDVFDIMRYRWYTDKTKIKNHGLFYFKARMPDSKYISMHRFILKLESYDNKMVVDHINRNTLDNRKRNLRIVSISENIKNSRVSRRNKYGCKGVSYDKQHKKYIAYISRGLDIRERYFFDTLEVAKDKAKELYKKYDFT